MPTEKKTPVQAVKTSLVCECGGEMVAGNSAYMTNPPQIPHKCEKCNATHTVMGRSYPSIDYEDQRPFAMCWPSEIGDGRTVDELWAKANAEPINIYSNECAGVEVWLSLTYDDDYDSYTGHLHKRKEGEGESLDCGLHRMQESAANLPIWRMMKT